MCACVPCCSRDGQFPQGPFVIYWHRARPGRAHTHAIQSSFHTCGSSGGRGSCSGQVYAFPGRAGPAATWTPQSQWTGQPCSQSYILSRKGQFGPRRASEVASESSGAFQAWRTSHGERGTTWKAVVSHTRTRAQRKLTSVKPRERDALLPAHETGELPSSRRALTDRRNIPTETPSSCAHRSEVVAAA